MIESILQKIGLRTFITLTLLLVAINFLTTGLGETVRGTTMSAFVPVGTTAALLGWGLASSRSKDWQAWSLILALGALLLWSSTAQLGAPLLNFSGSIPSALYQGFLWAHDHIPPDFSVIASAWVSLAEPSLGLWQRVSLWVQGLQSGFNIYDPVVRVLAWSALLWLISAWAGWFLRRRQSLISMAPALALLAIIVDYTGTDIFPLWGLLCITILLMGLMRYEENLLNWTKRGIDYAEIIMGETTAAVVLLSIALAIAAWIVPLASIKTIENALRARQTGSNPSLAKTLGLEQAPSKPDAFARYSAPGLPNEHLLGAGPELSHMPVMTISTGELPPAPTYELAKMAPYHRWRSNTFDIYTGTGWISSAVESESYAADAPMFEQIPEGYRTLQQNITIVNETDGKLYWDGTLYSADQPFEAGWRLRPASNSDPAADPFRSADLLGALSTAKSYHVESLLPAVDLEQLRAARAIYPENISKRYLQLPEKIPERVLALARDLTATAPTPYDQAKAIETYLRKTYPYTLDIPAPLFNRDVVDYFLFDLKKGYCDYYATSMVVLARTVGLPARIVVGYANGSYDPYSAEYNITQADAHAWVEVYFSGIGWVEFDPTANQPEIARLGGSNPSGDRKNPTNQQPGFGNFNTFLQELPELARWGILGLVGLAALMVILQIGEYWLLTQIPTTRAIQRIYREVYRLGRKLTSPANAGETTSEFAFTLDEHLRNLIKRGGPSRFLAPASEELHLLTDLYISAIYSPRPPHKKELRHALRAWQNLRWRLWLARVLKSKV